MQKFAYLYPKKVAKFLSGPSKNDQKYDPVINYTIPVEEAVVRIEFYTKFLEDRCRALRPKADRTFFRVLDRSRLTNQNQMRLKMEKRAVWLPVGQDDA